MANVVCNMEDCKYKSKRPLRKWQHSDGSKCYGCTLETISISRIADPDGDCATLIGELEMAQCRDYEPIEE